MDTADQILEEIKRAERILLHLHPGPDPDSVGSALAMRHVLRAMGKEADVIKGDSDLPKGLSHLPGFAEILPLNFFEADLSRYGLFIALDSADLGQVSKLGDVAHVGAPKTIVIDHHLTNPGYGDLNLIDPSAPATCQILFELFVRWGVELSAEAALCLYIGLYGDTGGFKYPGATKRTYEIAAELVGRAPDFHRAVFDMENSKEEGMIRYEALALLSVRTRFDGRLALAVLPRGLLEREGIRRPDTEGASIPNKLIAVKGWLVGASLVEKEPGRTYASFRTREPDRFDVSLLAKALGGGGHRAAAGALFAGTAAEAEAALLETAAALPGFTK